MKKTGGNIVWHALAFAVVAVWGVTFISTKILLSAGLTPALIFAIRFSVAYIGIWMLCICGCRVGRRKSYAAGSALNAPARSGEAAGARLFAASLRDELIFVFLGITGGSFYFLTENSALACTQACNVSFIVCSAPLLTALLTLAVRRFFKGQLASGLEDVSGRWTLVVGSLLAFAGMAAVIFDGQSLHFSAKGDLLAVGAAVCWALYSIFIVQMTTRYGSLFATRKVFFYGLLTIVPFVVGQGVELEVLARPEVWGNLLFLSLVASLGCFVLWNRVMAAIGNVTATNYVYLNPLFTLVAAVLVLGESLTLQSALGCAAILAGVVIGGSAGGGQVVTYASHSRK